MAKTLRERLFGTRTPPTPDHTRVNLGTVRHAVQTRAPTTWSAAAQWGINLSTIEPVSGVKEYQHLDLSALPFQKMTPERLLDVLSDASPDISRALWDFLRFCNPGWTVIAVTTPNGDVEVPAGTKVVADFMQRLEDEHGSSSVVINRLFIGAWSRGAFFAELVVGSDGKTPIDIATPDPATVRFRHRLDPERGPVWQLCQLQRNLIVPVDGPLVRYIPIDPLPSTPYGRSPASPAVFTALFALGMMYDIRRVVAQQGYPRLDLEIALAKLVDSMPEHLQDDADAASAWVRGVIDEIADVYAHLEPDDAYVHTDLVKVNRPVGTIDSSSLGGIAALITILERQAIRALKTMPLLMGITDGVSEANANRQWEIHVAGIKSLQHLGEGLMQYLLGKALQAGGIKGFVKFRFAELRAAEKLRDEMVREKNNTNTRYEYEMGWITHEEAALKAVGHVPAKNEAAAVELTLAFTSKPTGNPSAPPPSTPPGTPAPGVALPGADLTVAGDGVEADPTADQEDGTTERYSRLARLVHLILERAQ